MSPTKPLSPVKRPRKIHRASIATTVYEDAAIEAVAKARGIQKGRRGEGYSSLLRSMSLADIVAEYERLKNIMASAA